MPSITLTLTDTPAGGVSVASSFRPAIGHPCSPAQSYALDILARTRKEWGLPREDSPAPSIGFPHLYLCGPMSGLPDFNYPAFHQAAARLRGLGYRVTNPAENGLPKQSAWIEHMRADIKGLVDCDGLALLPGYENSKGAGVEIELAMGLGITVGSIHVWVDLVKSGHRFRVGADQVARDAAAIEVVGRPA